MLLGLRSRINAAFYWQTFVLNTNRGGNGWICGNLFLSERQISRSWNRLHLGDGRYLDSMSASDISDLDPITASEEVFFYSFSMSQTAKTLFS